MTFVQRTDWVDLPSTATPVMAADLLRIEQGVANAAVVADIPTAGTPTGNALRAAYVTAVVDSTGGVTLYQNGVEL